MINKVDTIIQGPLAKTLGIKKSYKGLVEPTALFGLMCVMSNMSRPAIELGPFIL